MYAIRSYYVLFWNALEPLWAELPAETNLELFGVTIRHIDQLSYNFV